MVTATATKCWVQEIVDKYCEDVLSDSIPACKYVKLAVKRHQKDLKHARKQGLHFDLESAEYVIDFFGSLKHSKGKWAGQLFELEAWQIFILWVVFGWKREDGTRRFRTAYNEVARKNGKSTLAAGLGLYGLGFDGEDGAEIYSFATKEDQAKIVFGEAQRMAIKSNRLGGRATIHKKAISVDETFSTFKPLGSDSENQDGLNPHFAIADELHAHRDSGMWDTMRGGVGARQQPLIFAITTAGFNRNSFCYQQRDYAIKVLEGIIEDDSFFAIIFTLDEKDDWKNEAVWPKANPNLGVSVSISDMRDMAKEALEMPSKQNNFLCKKLNIWTSQHVRWMPMDVWDACGKTIIEIDDLISQPCFGAVDLSSNTDVTCWGKIFVREDGFAFFPKFYMPRENAEKRQRQDKVPYLDWAEQGFITLTEGNVIDYKTIRANIMADCEIFDMCGIAFDRWNFEAVRQQLIDEGVPEKLLISFGQGFASMNSPMKKLEQIVLSKQLIHNRHPVLRWMADNVAAKTDAAGNIKPDKEKSTEKIDGIVTLIMALGLSFMQPKPEESVYESRGIISI